MKFLRRLFASYPLSRQNIIRLLNKLPAWLFPKTPRMVLNPFVVKSNHSLPQEEDPDEEDHSDWEDSALEASFDSFYLDSKAGRAWVGTRRMSTTWKEPPMSKYNALQAEIKKLREEIKRLVQMCPENQQPPPPPPMPQDKPYVEMNSSSMTTNVADSNEMLFDDDDCALRIDLDEEAQKEATKTNMRRVLSDITNVKLKPIGWSTPSGKQKSMFEDTRLNRDDVRYDLHEILRRRYAAMHSPIRPLENRSLSQFSDDPDKEDSFQCDLSLKDVSEIPHEEVATLY